MKDQTCSSSLPLSHYISLVTPLLLSHSPRSANPAICPSLSGSRGIPEACTGEEKNEGVSRQEKEKRTGLDHPSPFKGLCFLGLKKQSGECALTDMLFSVKTLSACLGLISLYWGLCERERVERGTGRTVQLKKERQGNTNWNVQHKSISQQCNMKKQWVSWFIHHFNWRAIWTWAELTEWSINVYRGLFGSIQWDAIVKVRIFISKCFFSFSFLFLWWGSMGRCSEGVKDDDKRSVGTDR